jgi:hypothetical protein
VGVGTAIDGLDDGQERALSAAGGAQRDPAVARDEYDRLGGSDLQCSTTLSQFAIRDASWMSEETL